MEDYVDYKFMLRELQHHRTWMTQSESNFYGNVQSYATSIRDPSYPQMAYIEKLYKKYININYKCELQHHLKKN